MGLATLDERAPYVVNTHFAPVDGTAAKPITTTATAAVRIDAITATNSDGIAHQVTLTLNDTIARLPLGSVSIPAGQGTNGTPSLDILAGSLPATVVGVVLPPGAALWLVMSVAIVAPNGVDIIALGGYV